MPKITFIEFSGKEHVVHDEVGRSLMQAAVDHLVPGIVADCGGSCSCATCHGYIDAAWGDSCNCLRNRPRCRSEEHTSELQSLRHLVCRLLLEKKRYLS